MLMKSEIQEDAGGGRSLLDTQNPCVGGSTLNPTSAPQPQKMAVSQPGKSGMRRRTSIEPVGQSRKFQNMSSEHVGL